MLRGCGGTNGEAQREAAVVRTRHGRRPLGPRYRPVLRESWSVFFSISQKVYFNWNGDF